MPLFSKRKTSGKSNSKGAKHAGRKENATLLANNLPKTTEPGIPQQQYFKVPHAESNDFLDRNIRRPSNSTAKCVANFPRRSRLSKSLPEVLVDDSILPLFMEYLQKQNAQNILHFWLAAETFCLSCRDKSYYKSRLKKQPCSYNVSPNNSSSNIGNITTNNGDSGIMNPAWNRNPGHNSEDKRFGNNGSPSIGESDVKNHNSLDSSNNSSSIPGERFEPNKSEGSIMVESSPHSVNKNDNCNSSDVHNSRLQADVHSNRPQINNPSENEVEVKQDTVRLEASSHKDGCHQHLKSMMDDALSIYRHFISLDATQPLCGVDENIRREIESNICSENGEIYPECFKVAQTFAFETLENRYFDGFVRSTYYQKHIMDILTSGKLFLADIMYNDSAVFYFMEFMEQEGKSFLLAFWFAVDSFRQELQSKLDKQQYNLDHALSDAMVLYEKYFSMQATQSLGVSDETRIRIENKICREGGPLPDCFEEPMENILTLLEEVYFPIFLASSVYFKYLNELFNAVGDIETDQTCADDTSSTASVCETTKLLESLANDAELQEDPDEIWQRPNVGLSIGRVNEYGIYEPGIEPQPGIDKKPKDTFGQKMKKFVSGESYKVKEEMAWQVAKMVLEDVKKQQGKASK